MRMAHGWTQGHVASLWNEQWPHEDGGPGISDQRISYWETWPQSGYEPSLKSLKRLAQLYQCDVSDLLDDGSYSHLDTANKMGSAGGEVWTASYGEADSLSAVRESDGTEFVPTLLSPNEIGQVLVPGLLLGGADDTELASYLHEFRLLSEASFDSAQERERTYDHLMQLFTRWAGTMKRREILRLLGWAASYVAAAPVLSHPSPDEQERAVGGVSVRDGTDGTVIDHIEAVLWHAKRQDDLLGPQAALHTVLSQRNVIRWLLAECPAALRSQALSLLSTASRMAGWFSFDMGDYQGAWFYYEQARNTAHEARNSALGAYVLCNMSHLATWQGTPRLGIDHAVAAQGWAAQTDDAPLKAYSHQVAARAYAADGQVCALEELENAGGYLGRDGERASIVHFNDRSQLAADLSRCYLLLGGSDKAAAAAQKSLKQAGASFVRNRAFATLYLGRAHLQANEVAEAANVIGDAIELAIRNRSPRFVGELRRVLDDFAPWQDVAAVRDLKARCVETRIT
jgi:tetratricopeptide (TPR) repeat protein